MCDDIQQAALVERQISATWIAAGAKDMTLADPTMFRQRLDEMLEAPLQPSTPQERDKQRLLEILGMR